MAEQSRAKWIALSAAAAVLLLVVAVLAPRLVSTPPNKPKSDPVHEAGVAVDAGCRVPDKLTLHPLPGAEDPPLVLFAEGNTKVMVDGTASFSGTDAPKHFKVGEHALRIESEGSQPINTNVRVDPWKPGLLYMPHDELLGTLLIRVDAQCTVCRAPVVKQTLGFAKRSDSKEYLLRESARQLRDHDFAAAGELLRGVPMKERKDRRFVLLAAMYYSEVSQPSDVAATLEELSKLDSGFAKLNDGMEELRISERLRRNKILLARWNKLTDRYSALVSRFEPQVRASMEERARRFEKLSDAFTKAAEAKDVLHEDELVRAAEDNLSDLVDAIRGTAPNDCAFQASVVATALQ
ncbi:MAG: hypothetical protein ACJ790_11595 [Myxococcaceae bacterium]